MEITVGMKAEFEYEVTNERTALAAGSGSLEVFATPFMVAIMEKAACEAIAPAMEKGQTSVGTGLDIAHTAATPVGMRVWAKAEVTEVNGRALTFKVTAFDEKGEIGSGTHTRFIVDAEKFTGKTYAKLEK